MKTITNNIYAAFAAFASVCFCLSPPRANAVSPAPDGGYANGHTAEGSNALFSLTTGAKNTADGYLALFSNTSGQFNTATGSQALYSNITGSTNTALGLNALFHNTTGESNTATGYLSLFHNTTGIRNTANGFQALDNNTTGRGNTASGFQALYSNTGNWNTATGHQALFSNTTDGANTADGYAALFRNTTGQSNTASGAFAASNNTTGFGNTAIGYIALENNTSGDYNTVLGYAAGSRITTANNVICIGADEFGFFGGNVSYSCFINNIRDVQTANADAIPVLIDSAGQLGTISSSRRFKHEIKPMDQASEAILALKPVTFHYKSDETNTPQFGLIAEEVAQVNPDLVVCDKKGEIYTVRYDAVNAMLLNEFLKERRKVEKLEATITQLKSSAAKQEATAAEQQEEIKVLTASLKEQARQIQNVRAQLELSKPTPQTAANNQ